MPKSQKPWNQWIADSDMNRLIVVAVSQVFTTVSVSAMQFWLLKFVFVSEAG